VAMSIESRRDIALRDFYCFTVKAISRIGRKISIMVVIVIIRLGARK
jgi:hypothetical protein